MAVAVVSRAQRAALKVAWMDVQTDDLKDESKAGVTKCVQMAVAPVPSAVPKAVPSEATALNAVKAAQSAALALTALPANPHWTVMQATRHAHPAPKHVMKAAPKSVNARIGLNGAKAVVMAAANAQVAASADRQTQMQPSKTT